MPACNLYSLLKNTGSSGCSKYMPAGVVDRVYLFDIDDMFSGRDYPEPNDAGYIDKSVINPSQCFALDIKTDSGQVTSEKGEDVQSRSLVFTAVVDHNIEKFLQIDGAIGNGMNVGVIVPIDNDKSYIIYSPYRKTKYASNYDSGTTYDSDHGFTVTFTATPVLFGCPMIKLGRSAMSVANNLHPYTELTTKDDKTVTGAATLKLNDSYQEVIKGSNYTLKATSSDTDDSFTWSSSNTSVATVGTNGEVTAVEEGYATISAISSKTNLTATCQIRVVSA